MMMMMMMMERGTSRDTSCYRLNRFNNGLQVGSGHAARVLAV